MTHAVCVTFIIITTTTIVDADQRLLSTLPDEKDPKVLAKGLEILVCADKNNDGWFTPSELLSLSVHGMLVRGLYSNADRRSSAIATNSHARSIFFHTVARQRASGGQRRAIAVYVLRLIRRR
jgi:hypothetical protein